MNECQCCFERFTKIRRTPFGCPNTECKYSVCKGCAKRFLGEQVSPKCMACDTILPREFLKEKLGLKWLTHELYAIQMANLLTTEKARFAQDMDEALRLKAAKERFAQVKALRKTWNTLQKKQTILLKTKPEDSRIKGRDISRSDIAEELLSLKQQINEITTKIEAIEQENETNMLLSDISDNKFEYKIRCPNPDCVGFANNLNRCTHCQIFICEQCHEEAGEAHICDPDTIKNVQLLRKDTKGCPQCNTPIHKIEGCDQMWCPQCKTAFSWNTGKIEKGIIHNPHYYQWQQGQNQVVRNVGDQACGGIPTRNNINAFVNDFRKLIGNTPKSNKSLKAKILILRGIILGHLVLLNTIQEDLDDHREAIQRREDILRNLRIRVLTGDIADEDEYKQKHLNNFLHKQSYAHEVIPIYEMATACVIERINEIIRQLSHESLEELRADVTIRTVNNVVITVAERFEILLSELTSVYEYVARELTKLSTHYPRKIKNRGKDIATLFEELPKISEACEKTVIDGYSDLEDTWGNPITERFGEV